MTEFGGPTNNGTIYSLDMGLAPFVNTALFTGKQGSAVTLIGTHLKGTTSVTFNGVAASFKVLSDTHLTATVPPGATTGPIHVVTPGGESAEQKELCRKALTH